jgi:ubiquinone/menaquinone biosynthesis C-methylase UbiE
LRKKRVAWGGAVSHKLARMSEEKSYVIGTHDAEIERLGVQHRVWRPSVLDLWERGGITTGQTVLDIGAGPGHATLDLAEIVGRDGKVIALERSHRFLTALSAFAAERGLSNIETVEADLLEYVWPEAVADRAWCRWVLAFINDPAKVLRGIARALKPGGKLLIQEYYDYASWHLAPRSPQFEDYVAKIIAKWRASGGEPNVGLALPHLLPEAGLEIEFVRPVAFAARMNDFAANWPMDFARQYIPVMLADGDIGKAEAEGVAALLDRYEADPNALVVTPGLLQIAACKR